MSGIDYDKILADARNSAYLDVLRAVLDAHQCTGAGKVPKGHEFWIVIDLTYPGTLYPSQFKGQNTLTIVLQNQFSHLRVFQDRFELILVFNRVPHFMSIPFDGVREFKDPGGPMHLIFNAPSIAYRSPEFYAMRQRLIASLPKVGKTDETNVVRPTFGRRRDGSWPGGPPKSA